MEIGLVAGGDVTRLLRQWSDGRDEAFRELLSVAHNRLRLMASARMRCERPDHTLQATVVVGELSADGPRYTVPGSPKPPWRDSWRWRRVGE